jgi:SAM-dependent methyltransferase
LKVEKRLKGEDILDTLARKARPWVPFTALNTVWRMMDKEAKTMLDVGCGKGEPMAFINRQGKFKVVGIDIFKPYLEEAREKSHVLRPKSNNKQGHRTSDLGQIYSNLILGNVRNLPFKDQSFDLVICIEVLEHLEKKDGERLLSELERVAKRQILLTTPVGKYEQHPFEANPHQEHKYIWKPRELKEKGYKVRGVGFKGMGGEGSWAVQLPSVLQPFRYLIYSLGTLFSYFFPEVACHIVAEKNFGILKELEKRFRHKSF